jgi:hypothetical protein
MDLKKKIAFFFTEKILPFNQGFFYYQALRIVERCCPTDSSCSLIHIGKNLDCYIAVEFFSHLVYINIAFFTEALMGQW